MVVVVVVMIEAPCVTVFSSNNQSLSVFQVIPLPNKIFFDFCTYLALSPLSPDPREFFFVRGFIFSPVAESSKVLPMKRPKEPDPLEPRL